MRTTGVIFFMAGWNGPKPAISIVAAVISVLRRLHPGLGCREEEARVAAAHIDPTWKLLLGFVASPQNQLLSIPASACPFLQQCCLSSPCALRRGQTAVYFAAARKEGFGYHRGCGMLVNDRTLHNVITRSSSMHSSQLCTMETCPHVPNVR